MLQITIPALKNFWDEKLEEFINTDAWTLCLEHSLISISKWEGIFHKAFVGTGEKTIDEVVECTPKGIVPIIEYNRWVNLREKIIGDSEASFYYEESENE